MKINLLDKTKKKKFIEGASDLGLNKIKELLIRTGKERIRAYSGNLSKEEIMDLWRVFPIEGIGLYVGKEIIDQKGIRTVRLSVDALHSWKNQITQNIIKLNSEQEEIWFRGSDVDLKKDQENFKGFVAVLSSDGKDFVGTGKIGNNGKTLFGFLPKERRRRSQILN
jgi:NOL1/NOP2/fmu family ribosome biogenesis protein